MTKLFGTLTILCAFAVALIRGSDTETIFAEFMDKIDECKVELGANDSDVEELFGETPPSTMEGKCLRACLLKKYELMNENGRFVKETILSHIQEYIDGSNEIFDIITEIVEKCSEIDVADDHCEAAEQYGACFKDEAKAQNIEDKVHI